MKMNGNEIKPGNIIKHQDTGRKLNERFRAAETVERIRLDQKKHTYLYPEGDMLVFMNAERNKLFWKSRTQNLLSKAKQRRIHISLRHSQTARAQPFRPLLVLAKGSSSTHQMDHTSNGRINAPARGL